jgi:hypothetical protein
VVVEHALGFFRCGSQTISLVPGPAAIVDVDDDIVVVVDDDGAAACKDDAIGLVVEGASGTSRERIVLL